MVVENMPNSKLSILMICHHRRHKVFARSCAMAKQLVQRGHKVTLLLIAENRRIGIVESQLDGVRIIETPDLLWGRLRSGWDVWDLVNRVFFLSKDKSSYDLVHCFETRPVTIYPALFYSNRHRVPFITDWNDWYGRGGLIEINRPKWFRVLLSGVETYYEEAFRTLGSGLTVISRALEQRAIQLGVPPEQICYISGGASPDLFPLRAKEECRRRLGFSLTDPILGFSSMDSYLDIEIVLKSLARIAKIYPSVKLILTGNVNKSIMKQAEVYGLRDHIYKTGYLPFEELPWYLGCADIFLLPFPNKIYNIGRWPNKICDYMCLGRPTVSNPFGDIKTLFENYPVGLLADFDPVDFSEKIISLLEHPDVSSGLGRDARCVAETHYSWPVLAGNLEKFYYQVLGAQSGIEFANFSVNKSSDQSSKQGLTCLNR